MKRAPMPAKVKVGCHTYAVVRLSSMMMPKTEGGADWGCCEFRQRRLLIRKWLRRSTAQETLLHEVLHACTYPDMIAVTKTDEDFVTKLSTNLLEVIQDNPDLLEYLTT